ncbi:hypothetical protein E2C01_074663 [Portunus trituberculatus]|uniref:Uncharacterized protein n=1 Tax=Portunus trituberculatus TaxID=210409 RepID=A0A5B7IDQ7_PORTR|nr:hypothetical protein [Portunus trituberculatus]
MIAVTWSRQMDLHSRQV